MQIHVRTIEDRIVFIKTLHCKNCSASETKHVSFEKKFRLEKTKKSIINLWGNSS